MKLYFLMHYSPISRVLMLFCIAKHLLYSLFNMQKKKKKKMRINQTIWVVNQKAENMN